MQHNYTYFKYIAMPAPSRTYPQRVYDVTLKWPIKCFVIQKCTNKQNKFLAKSDAVTNYLNNCFFLLLHYSGCFSLLSVPFPSPLLPSCPLPILLFPFPFLSSSPAFSLPLFLLVFLIFFLPLPFSCLPFSVPLPFHSLCSLLFLSLIYFNFSISVSPLSPSSSIFPSHGVGFYNPDFFQLTPTMGQALSWVLSTQTTDSVHTSFFLILVNFLSSWILS